MLTHIYGVCVRVLSVGVDRGICFFSAVRHPTRAISITRATSELKFHLTVTPWPLPGTSQHCCFLFNNTAVFALSEGSSLLLFKKKFKVGRNLLNRYTVVHTNNQAVDTKILCLHWQRKLRTFQVFYWVSHPERRKMSATVDWVLIYICKQ